MHAFPDKCSVSPHCRWLRNDVSAVCLTSSERPCIALRKVVFCELKGHVLQCKRWSFATCWKSTVCVSRSVAAVRFAFHGPPLYVFSWFAAAYPNQNRSLGFFLVFRSCPPAKRPFPSRAWLPMSRQGGISVGCGN